MSSEKRIDITQPLWDQSTFVGRFRHFAFISNPLLTFVPEKELYAARDLYLKYKAGEEPAGTTKSQVIRAKQLYESAFHPDSGELQNVFGRMSFQMPGGCLATGAMLQWYSGSFVAVEGIWWRLPVAALGGGIGFLVYAVEGGRAVLFKTRTATAVVFWQWVNQSFNALVNYTNRNANAPLSTKQMGVAYVSAMTAAMSTALTFKFVIQKRATNPILARFVPFVAVAAANWVNIPLMRQNEILLGLNVTDENGKIIGKSQIAPIKGISQVVTSRIVMCAPGMLLLPVIMEKIEPKPWMQRIKRTHILIQTVIVGMFLTFMVPTACALFPQRCKLSIDTIKRFEKENYEEILKNTDGKPPQYVYFNKGL